MNDEVDGVKSTPPRNLRTSSQFRTLCHDCDGGGAVPIRRAAVALSPGWLSLWQTRFCDTCEGGAWLSGIVAPL